MSLKANKINTRVSPRSSKDKKEKRILFRMKVQGTDISSVPIPEPESYKRDEIPTRKLSSVEESMKRGGRRLPTLNNFPIDQASSSLQKSVRRCNPRESVQWALEMFWTQRVSGPTSGIDV